MGGQHGHKGAGPKKSHKSGSEKKYVEIPKLKKAPENPFDKFANSKKKHEVINRRVKGEDRNVGKARKNAIESRKNRLQQDYQSTKKTNSFADRRFGESDADLSLEDKMFLRFQKERVKKARNVSLFNLEGGDDNVLTHKGQVLGESNMGEDDWHSDDDDDKGSLGRDVVNNLHFGGGMVATKGSNIYGPGGPGEGHDGGENKAPKNRLDALQEIVAKSKMFKLQKKEAKEEQENDREKLDKDFQALVSGALLDFKPTRRDRSEDKDENDVIDEYDTALRAMAFEVKARPSDRTKSDEEKAVEARSRLEELEAARLRRMTSATNPEDNAEAEKALNNHGDVKKRNRMTDDEVDGSFGSNYKKDEDESEDEEEEEDEEEDEEEGEDEDEEVDDDDDDEEDDWEEEETEGAAESKTEVLKKKSSKKVEVEEDDDAELDEDDEEEEEGEAEVVKEEEEEVVPDRVVKKLKKADRAVEQLAHEGVNDLMPHKVHCPSSMEDFDNMTAQYVRSPADLRELISRILVWSSVHLPGKEGSDNRGRMHNFLDVLLKLFVRVGDSLCVGSSTESEVQGQLDFLCMSIFKLGQDVADACPLLWGRTLKLMQNQLQKRLRDFVQGNRESCWPSLGQLLLLRLSGHVFAVTDFRHAVIGPASLLLCQCLTQCPVRTHKDVASGLLACSILVGFNEETKRVVPECLEFVRSVVCTFCPAQSLKSDLSSAFTAPQKTFDITGTALKGLRAASAKYSGSQTDKKMKNENIHFRISWATFGKEKKSDLDLNSGAWAVSFLFTSQMLLSKLVEMYTEVTAFPELFYPSLMVLKLLRPQDKPSVLEQLQVYHADLLESIIKISDARKKSRSALQWRKSVKVSIEVKNPKFQADYTFKKDLDPDENRVKLKQLTRQSKRETKAAMRELRRDSDFIDQLSYAEQNEKKDKLKAERVKNFGWMEEQQASINMQVRKGGELMTGGGSSVARKARVKR